MNKYSAKDVKLLGEGAQLKAYIDKKHGSLKDFYYKHDLKVSLVSFRTYLARDKISSDVLKLALVKALNKGYNDIVKSKEEQIKEIVKNITCNIDLYNDKSDEYVLDIVIKQTKNLGFDRHTSDMYIAKAKYYHKMNRISHVMDCYEMAISIMKRMDISAMVQYYIEMVIIYFRENMKDNALDIINILDEYIKLYKKNLSNNILFRFYYWKGIMYLEKDSILCRKLFKKALNYASTNVEKAGTIQNIGLSYRYEKVYKLAIAKYEEAYNLYDEDDIVRRSSIWNNIAMVNMCQSSLIKASENINKAIEMLSNKMDYRFYMKYLHTFAKINLLKGNEKEVIKYFEALEKCCNKELDKEVLMYDITEILNYIVAQSNLKAIAEVIMRIKEMQVSEKFKKDLLGCLGIIYIKLERRA